nr:exosome complex component RRP46 [Seculamonas ecuadoriensis]
MSASASTADLPAANVTKHNRRKDYRAHNQLRELSAEVGLLNRADGSASMSYDKTAVMVGVYGPREVPPRKEVQGKCVIEATLRPRSGLPTNRDKEIERVLEGILEQVVMTALHPRSIISVIVQVLDDDGSLLAASVNATILALMDAGVPLRTVAAASSCCVAADGNTLYIDPTLEEENSAASTHTVVLDGIQGSVLAVRSLGCDFSAEHFVSCMDVSAQACDKLREFMRIVMERKSNAASQRS